MRCYARKLHLQDEQSALSEEYVIQEYKRRIALELVDKLPFRIKRGVMDDPNMIAVELDAVIIDSNKFISKLNELLYEDEFDESITGSATGTL